MFDSRIKDRRFKPQWDPNLKKKLDQKKESSKQPKEDKKEQK